MVPPSAVPWRRGSCFSCGQQGHGVNRCSRLDVSFPFLLPGWSVDVRNGQYRASRIRGDGRNYYPGKGGWSGREGQPPGSSKIVMLLTRGGGASSGGGALAGVATAGVWCTRKSRWTQGFPALGSHSPADGGRGERSFRMTVGMCWQITHQMCRPRLWRWVKRFILGAACVCLKGGYDLLGG